MTRVFFARESVDNEDSLSWNERFYRVVSVSPIWVGLGIVGALLASYLAIALGSWLGGAFAERLLGAALD